MITEKQVRAIARTLGGTPRADMIAAIVEGWPEAVSVAKLSTRKRAAAFLGQIMTETGGLTILSESGAYSAKGIMKTFGVGKHSANVTAEEAASIARLPIAQRGPRLFNRVYGVGNPKKAAEFNNRGPNDGWLYRGGGMMQCTGKNNYAAMAKKTGLPLVEHPEMLHNPVTAFKSAYLEWGQDARANRTADAIGGSGAALKASLATNRRVINGGTNGMDKYPSYFAAALKQLDDWDTVAPATLISQTDEDTAVEPAADLEVEEPADAEDPASAPPNVVPIDEPDAVGDPILYNVQRRLKARRYSPGVLDGRWGSGTSGALGGYRNDRGIDFAMPRNLETFHQVSDVIRADLTKAEAEGWFRPVSQDRAAADAKVIKQVAPEVVPTKRNFLVTLWGSVAAFFTAAVNTVSGYVSQAWDFFTDHKDVVDDHPGIMSTVWEKVTHVPPAVWLALAGAGLAFVAYNSLTAIRTSVNAVKTGERQ